MVIWECEVRDFFDHNRVLGSFQTKKKIEVVNKINEIFSNEGIEFRISLYYLEALQRLETKEHSSSIDRLAHCIKFKRVR